MVYRALACWIGLVLLSSCATYEGLLTDMIQAPASINYLHDTPPNNLKKVDSISVSLPVITDARIAHSSRLTKKASAFYPLLIFNHWKQRFEFGLGSDIIAEDVPRHIQKSLIDEVNRSTAIYAGKDLQRDLVLELEVEEFRAVGPYTTNGYFYYFFIVFIMYHSEKAGPSEVVMTLNYKLKNKGELLRSGTVSQRDSVAMPRILSRNRTQMRTFFPISQAEGLAEVLKKNIELISREVEDELAH